MQLYPAARACVCVLLLALLCGLSVNDGLSRNRAPGPLAMRYRIDAAQSSFMIRTFSGGVLWFKGHDHFVAARDFTGEVELTPTSVTPARSP